MSTYKQAIQASKGKRTDRVFQEIIVELDVATLQILPHMGELFVGISQSGIIQ